MNNTIMFIVAIIAIIISSAFAQEFKLKMNTLYITASYKSVSQFNTYGANPNSQALVMLEAYGMNYDVVELPTESLTLENEGVALYNSIVIDGATQDMLAPLKNQIEDYQRRYSIRVTYLNCEPDRTIFSDYSQNIEGRDVRLTEQGVEFAKKYHMNGELIIFNINNCVLDQKNECIPYYHYEVKIENPKITPLLKYENLNEYAGAVVRYNDLESIHFWIPFIDSSIASFVSHLWISWANYGMIMVIEDFTLAFKWMISSLILVSTELTAPWMAVHHTTEHRLKIWKILLSGRKIFLVVYLKVLILKLN